MILSCCRKNVLLHKAIQLNEFYHLNKIKFFVQKTGNCLNLFTDQVKYYKCHLIFNK